jgi:hypothetical protein
VRPPVARKWAHTLYHGLQSSCWDLGCGCVKDMMSGGRSLDTPGM